MQQLVFQLQAPMAAWGLPAVGETRLTAGYASHSAIVGLLGAALGIERGEEAVHAGLRDGYGFAVAVLDEGSLLRDYHTIQVPPRTALTGRPRATRRHELAAPRLVTTLSSRDYRVNASCLIALQPQTQAPVSLQALAEALRKPRYLLYLGRKSCPPSAPLWPHVIDAPSAREAFARYGELHEQARTQARADDDVSARRRVEPAHVEPLPALVRMAFDEHTEAGLTASLTTVRKDRLIRRKGWQFGDRHEHVALLEGDV